MGFVGFKSTEEAAAALKYFNQTFIDATRISVEVSGSCKGAACYAEAINPTACVTGKGLRSWKPGSEGKGRCAHTKRAA